MSAKVDEFVSEKHVVELTWEEDVNSELLCGGLKATGHIDVGRQVRCVDFEGGPDGTFDCPPHVQPEPHFDWEVPQAFVQFRVEAVTSKSHFLIFVWVLIS